MRYLVFILSICFCLYYFRELGKNIVVQNNKKILAISQYTNIIRCGNGRFGSAMESSAKGWV